MLDIIEIIIIIIIKNQTTNAYYLRNCPTIENYLVKPYVSSLIFIHIKIHCSGFTLYINLWAKVTGLLSD